MKAAYLAGAMETISDEGLSWRREFSDALKNIGIKCFIPNDEEKKLKKHNNMKELKNTNIKKYIKIMRQFIAMDLNFVQQSDFLIAKWNGEQTTGTVHETGYAYQLRIPTYLVTSVPTNQIPGWFLACFTKIFASLDELIKFLKK